MIETLLLAPTRELVTYLGSDASLAALAPRGVWQEPAPQDPVGQERVAVTVLYEAGTSEHTGGGSRTLECHYLVQATGPAALIDDILTAAKRIDKMLHFGIAVLPGYVVMAAFLEDPIERTEAEPVTGIRWESRGGRYRLDVVAA